MKVSKNRNNIFRDFLGCRFCPSGVFRFGDPASNKNPAANRTLRLTYAGSRGGDPAGTNVAS